MERERCGRECAPTWLQHDVRRGKEACTRRCSHGHAAAFAAAVGCARGCSGTGITGTKLLRQQLLDQLPLLQLVTPHNIIQIVYVAAAEAQRPPPDSCTGHSRHHDLLAPPSNHALEFVVVIVIHTMNRQTDTGTCRHLISSALMLIPTGTLLLPILFVIRSATPRLPTVVVKRHPAG